MKKITHITSSTNGENSNSTQLGKAIIEKLHTQYPGSSLTTRDLVTNPTPHLSGAHLAAFFTPEDQQNPELTELAAYSKTAIAELMETDILVISVPMINFSIPSQLKSWIDQVARAGITFKYSENGPEGLVKGKKVYVALASGALYSDGPYKAFDFIEPYLRGALGFIGMTDITVFRVEGTNMPDLKDQALENAIQKIALTEDAEVIA
jgi:FMN-dependent NADH-azoreductase